MRSNVNIVFEKHLRDSYIGSHLSHNLRSQYGKRNLRVIKGDTIKVMRGEYKNVEGKVEKVNTQKSTLIIEGIQREASKGGKVKIQIHSSNVIITSLNLQDKKRASIITRGKINDSKINEAIKEKKPGRSKKTKTTNTKNDKKIMVKPKTNKKKVQNSKSQGNHEK